MISAELIQQNKEKFDAFRALNLPLGHYFITGGGPLGIRNLRAINDIDIVVSLELWEQLASKYGVVELKGVTKIVFSNIDVEAFKEGSFKEETLEGPSVLDRLARADVIEGLAFESLEDMIFFKRRSGRPKDLQDIALAERYLESL